MCVFVNDVWHLICVIERSHSKMHDELEAAVCGDTWRFGPCASFVSCHSQIGLLHMLKNAQDASGKFIDVTGEPAAPNRKSLRPLSSAAAAAKGCPDSLWGSDGMSVAAQLKKLQPFLSRPFNILNLDGEVFVSLDQPAEDYDFSKDPTVLSDYTASGSPNWLTYWSTWRVRLTNLATNPYVVHIVCCISATHTHSAW